MARAHDPETQPVLEAAYQAYEAGGYVEIVEAVTPLLIEAGMRAVIEHIEKNHGLDECVCTGCLREDLLGEACDRG